MPVKGQVYATEFQVFEFNISGFSIQELADKFPVPQEHLTKEIISVQMFFF